MSTIGPELKWLNVKQACAYLGCSSSTLYREIERGDLTPDGRVGRAPRFSIQLLDAYVQRRNLGAENVGRPIRTEVHHADQRQGCEAREGRSRDQGRQERSERTGSVHREDRVSGSEDREEDRSGR